MGHRFMISLPFGEVMISIHWLRIVPMYIAHRALFSKLIRLEMMNFDMILGMDFPDKYNTSIDYRRQQVIFRPEDDELFKFVGEPRKKRGFLDCTGSKKTTIARVHGILGSYCRQKSGREAKDR